MKIDFHIPVQWKLGRHGKLFYYYRRKGERNTIRDTHGRHSSAEGKTVSPPHGNC